MTGEAIARHMLKKGMGSKDTDAQGYHHQDSYLQGMARCLAWVSGRIDTAGATLTTPYLCQGYCFQAVGRNLLIERG